MYLCNLYPLVPFSFINIFILQIFPYQIISMNKQCATLLPDRRVQVITRTLIIIWTYVKCIKIVYITKSYNMHCELCTFNHHHQDVVLHYRSQKLVIFTQLQAGRVAAVTYISVTAWTPSCDFKLKQAATVKMVAMGRWV